jgi:hypothetical protein
MDANGRKDEDKAAKDQDIDAQYYARLEAKRQRNREFARESKERKKQRFVYAFEVEFIC